MKTWKRMIVTALVMLTPLAAFAATAAVTGGCPWGCCP